jgi:hypothetical protein
VAKVHGQYSNRKAAEILAQAASIAEKASPPFSFNFTEAAKAAYIIARESMGDADLEQPLGLPPTNSDA